MLTLKSPFVSSCFVFRCWMSNLELHSLQGSTLLQTHIPALSYLKVFPFIIIDLILLSFLILYSTDPHMNGNYIYSYIIYIKYDICIYIKTKEQIIISSQQDLTFVDFIKKKYQISVSFLIPLLYLLSVFFYNLVLIDSSLDKPET